MYVIYGHKLDFDIKGPLGAWKILDGQLPESFIAKVYASAQAHGLPNKKTVERLVLSTNLDPSLLIGYVVIEGPKGVLHPFSVWKAR